MKKILLASLIAISFIQAKELNPSMQGFMNDLSVEAKNKIQIFRDLITPEAKSFLLPNRLVKKETQFLAFHVIQMIYRKTDSMNIQIKLLNHSLQLQILTDLLMLKR